MTPPLSSLVIATKNRHKVSELSSFLSELQISVRSLDDFQHILTVEEDGATFRENALKKAREVYRLSGMPALADDSGLEVFYLNGRPGVHSARYAGSDATDDQNNLKLLRELKGVAPRRRRARFVAHLALVGPGIEECTVGTCIGQISEVPMGTHGFGYDPLFIPDGYDKSYAELSVEEKNSISHRSRAFEPMRHILEHHSH